MNITSKTFIDLVQHRGIKPATVFKLNDMIIDTLCQLNEGKRALINEKMYSIDNKYGENLPTKLKAKNGRYFYHFRNYFDPKMNEFFTVWINLYYLLDLQHEMKTNCL